MTKEQIKTRLKQIVNKITEMEIEYNEKTVYFRGKIRNSKTQKEADKYMKQLLDKQMSLSKGIRFAKEEFFKQSQALKRAVR